MQNSTRIVVNTAILYGKMFITIAIALFSTRLILDALGTDDFGIFALIGGVIGALSFLNKAMSSATQRFLSYHRNKGAEKLQSVFNTALALHVFIGLVFIVLLEGAGFFLFNGFLNIAESRIPVAKFVFHCMVASTFFSVIAVPYDSIMNAKENMFVFALFSILESVFKLGIALFLYYTPADRLATYGLCMALMLLLSRTAKRIYSRLHYKETKINFKSIDWKLMKEMGGFSGWVTIEIISHIAKGEGIPIMLNLFFGTTANAAYGVSTQIRQNISFFAEMIFKSSNPQVIQNIGDGNITKSIRLSTTVCKFSFLLMALFSLPLIVKMPYVLSIWLKKVPEDAVLFCQLVLTTQLIIMLARGLNFFIDGIGKIRTYRLTLSLFNVIVFPIAYVFLKLGFSAGFVFAGIILSDVSVVIARIYFASKYSEMNAFAFYKAVPLKLIPFTITLVLLLFQASKSLSVAPFFNLVLITLLSTVFLSLGYWIFILDKNEKDILFSLWRKLKKKVLIV